MLEVIDMSINQIMHHIIYGSEVDKMRLVSCEQLNYHALLRLSSDESRAVASMARHALLTRRPALLHRDIYMSGDFSNHPLTVEQDAILMESIYRDLEKYIATKHQRIYEKTRYWRRQIVKTNACYIFSTLLCRWEMKRQKKEKRLASLRLELLNEFSYFYEKHDLA